MNLWKVTPSRINDVISSDMFNVPITWLKFKSSPRVLKCLTYYIKYHISFKFTHRISNADVSVDSRLRFDIGGVRCSSYHHSKVTSEEQNVMSFLTSYHVVYCKTSRSFLISCIYIISTFKTAVIPFNNFEKYWSEASTFIFVWLFCFFTSKQVVWIQNNGGIIHVDIVVKTSIIFIDRSYVRSKGIRCSAQGCPGAVDTLPPLIV